MPASPIARRLVPAGLVALTVFLAAGAAFAATDGSARPGQPNPEEVFVPEPRLGDRGTYNLTITGDWDYGPFREGVPFRFMDFRWQDGGLLLAGDGRLHDTEQLVVEAMEYEHAIVPEAEDWGFQEVQRWNATERTFHFATGNATRLALDTTGTPIEHPPLTMEVLGIPYSKANVHLPPESLRYFDPFGDVDGILAFPLQGTTVRPGDGFELAAQILGLGYAFGMANVTAFEDVEGHRLARLAVGQDPELASVEGLARGVTLWLADGIPYPVKLEWAVGGARMSMQLVGFEGGPQGRGAPSGPAPALEPLDRTPRPAWTLDDAGVEHPFPLSAAFETAMEDPQFTGLRDFMARNPDAYVSRAWDTSSEGEGSWWIWITGEEETYNLAVYPWQPIPGGPRLWRFEGEAEDNDWFTLTPPPSKLPDTMPTVASLLSRWWAYAGADALEGQSTWSFRVRCYDLLWSETCTNVTVDYHVGRFDHSTSGYEPSTDPSSLGFSQTSVRVEDAIEGHARPDQEEVLVHRSSFGEIRTTYGADTPAAPPAQGDPAAPPAPAARFATVLSPSVPQAAGAGLFALAAGLAYLLWPAVKGTGFAGLFSRLSEPELLDHPHRRRIHDLVEAQPGIHFNALLRASGLANGTLAHHLEALEKGGKVRKLLAGGYACYFPGQGRRDPAAAALKAPGARKVLREIRAAGGLSNLDVARRTGLDPGTVHYHVQRLAAAGLVAARRDGRSNRLHAIPAADGGR